MKNLYSLSVLLTLLLVSYNVFGQRGDSFLIKGRVLDAKSGAPLSYTTISIHSKADSSLVTGNISDETGRFEITAPAGEFWAQVQFVSYASKIVPNITLNKSNPSVNLGDILLAEDAETLSEVVVAGEREQMELNLDKRVFNVSSDITNIGRNAAEILDNVPSVAVDVDGNVSLRGSSSVRILVDGKPSGLVGLSSPDALRMLQGDLIERIEVITNPSARYEAEGMAGIINIILKKDRRNGLNGSFTVNLGHPEDYGVSANVNVRRKWVNIFSSYGFNYRNSPGSGHAYRESYEQDTTYSNRTQERERGGLSHNFRLGAAFPLSDKSNLTASGFYRFSDQSSSTDVGYVYWNKHNDILRRNLRSEDEMEDDSNMDFELNFTQNFNREGQKLTAAAQYRKGEEIEESDIVENEYVGAELVPGVLQRTLNKEENTDILLQADYIHPFGNDGQFEVGYKSTFREINTQYDAFEKVGGNWDIMDEFSNHFIYNENIHSVYAIVGNKVDRFSYQVGARAELSDVKTELRATDNVNDRSYFDLFPSAHVTYELKNDNSIQASYSRRLNRPRFWNLNPFVSLSDITNIRTGNPNLDPDYTNSYEVGYLKNWALSSLYAGAYYRHTTDVVQWLSRMENGVTYTRPENFGTMDAYGLEANISKDLAQWWKLSVNGNFYRAITEGTAFDRPLKSDTYTFSGRLNSRITLWKSVNYQTNLFYRAPEETPQGKRKSFTSIDMALSKDILKGKGTLTFSVSDVLNSRKWRSETFADNFYEESESQWRSRQFRLTFSYRLNQRKGMQRERMRNEGFEGGGEMEEMGGF